jgi:hypothetical protein
MKCEEFLIAMESGGWLRRRMAAHHAASCPDCAAAHRVWLEMKRQMGEPEPLLDRERRLWERAAGEARVSARARDIWPWAIAGVAAMCLVLITLKLTVWDVKKPPGDREIVKVDPAPSPPDVVVVDAREELDRLGASTKELEAELGELRKQAQRMDAQRQVAMVIEKFDRW